MKKMLYALSLILSFTAYASEDVAKKRDILEFIRITAVSEETLDAFLPQVAPCFIADSEKGLQVEEVISEAKKQILSDAFLERFIALFDKQFTHAEIKALLQYYKSEEMKKLIKNCPPIYTEIFSSFNKVIQDIVTNAPETEASALKRLNSNVISISGSNFKEEIQDSKIPVILDVYSTFCPPCKVVAPVFSELSSNYVGKIKFAKLNVDAESSLAQELGVSAMPTFLFIKDGKTVDQHVGLIDREGLLSKIEKNLF